MESFSTETGIKYFVRVNWADRWQVYQRLNELDIPCFCQANQPLQVEITNANVAMQIWSVLRSCTASRQELISTLENCWHLASQ
ncbi:Asr1405/Asl0597 family protein [Richelia sinica]|uniref:Asr1405/Asl0597 family protein n=1 Tax=Richelia sinica TaxID=1357545 RepID=UPI0016874E11|nr:Asr1405/Asl0597 family protein [Richelia sinica]MBD2663897.1 hypothetical protein [Richelia sinica FACHB-800]